MPFDCMIRSVYITAKDKVNAANIGGMIGGLRQFNANNLNQFIPSPADVKDKEKDWAKFSSFIKGRQDAYVKHYKKSLFHAFKLRSFFEWPYKNYKVKPFILSTEELATLFHFPSGLVTQTPTLKRIESKKSGAPANLPI